MSADAARSERLTSPLVTSAAHAEDATAPTIEVQGHPVDGVPPNVWRIHGRDYDLSSFVDEHPGGAAFILMGKGLDCTHFFEFYHVFSVPRKRLAKYDVTDGATPPVPECNSAFMEDVRAMVRDHFGASSFSHGRHKAGGWQIGVMALLLCLEVASAYTWWVHESVLAGAVCGMLNYVIMVNLLHDGCHAALSTRPWVNYLGHLLGASPWVCGQASWWLQHVVSHHPNINQLGLDIDAHHFPWLRWHRRVVYEIAGGRVAGLHQMAWHLLAYMFSTMMMSLFHPFMYICPPPPSLPPLVTRGMRPPYPPYRRW